MMRFLAGYTVGTAPAEIGEEADVSMRFVRLYLFSY